MVFYILDILNSTQFVDHFYQKFVFDVFEYIFYEKSDHNLTSQLVRFYESDVNSASKLNICH